MQKKTSGPGSTLNLETKGRDNDRIQSRVDQNPEILIGTETNLDQAKQVQCWNCGKTCHFRRQCKSPKKKNEDDFANAVTEEVHDALLLAVDSPLDD